MCHLLADPEQSLTVVQIRKRQSASSLEVLLLLDLTWRKIRLIRLAKNLLL
jgi:hypothetical protein